MAFSQERESAAQEPNKAMKAAQTAKTKWFHS